MMSEGLIYVLGIFFIPFAHPTLNPNFNISYMSWFLEHGDIQQTNALVNLWDVALSLIPNLADGTPPFVIFIDFTPFPEPPPNPVIADPVCPLPQHVDDEMLPSINMALSHPHL
ncbi:hypothetical protein QAD02_002876 [Eretmocerus hayati]|uniref:Uncharacterized protein n=1 Tax=Eretmocerus hayati TaxID=131215 RepID=A0ACC2NKI9_9HYME|nr:hypothetical protein QAD02_002876 [Eretmocerus hayati]